MLAVSEQVVEPGEVVEQPTDRCTVAEPLEQLQGTFGVAPSKNPAPVTLSAMEAWKSASAIRRVSVDASASSSARSASSCAATQSRLIRWQRARHWKMSERS